MPGRISSALGQGSRAGASGFLALRFLPGHTGAARRTCQCDRREPRIYICVTAITFEWCPTAAGLTRQGDGRPAIWRRAQLALKTLAAAAIAAAILVATTTRAVPQSGVVEAAWSSSQKAR